MNHIIICGHGNFASGIESTLEMLCGRQEKISFVNFISTDTSENLKEKFIEIINQHQVAKNIIFFTDILGGTPFRLAAELSTKFSNIEVFSGTNISMILEALFLEVENIEEYSQIVINCGKEACNSFKIKQKSSPIPKHFPQNDGI